MGTDAEEEGPGRTLFFVENVRQATVGEKWWQDHQRCSHDLMTGNRTEEEVEDNLLCSGGGTELLIKSNRFWWNRKRSSGMCVCVSQE